MDARGTPLATNQQGRAHTPGPEDRMRGGIGIGTIILIIIIIILF